jgi:Coenzyme PQQ synthesis protein D (PqqD)
MTVALNERVVPAAQVLFKDIGGEAVLLDLGTETYFGLNETGARFWHQLTSSPSVLDAWTVLRDEFDVAPDELLDDLRLLIDQLLRHRLVQVDGD